MNLQRVVCLTPSITETLFSLGAGERVVGVTDSCDYPAEVHKIPHVCSWFDPDMGRIKSLRPDLVIGLKTAHERLAPVFEDQGMHYEFLNPGTIPDVLDDLLRLGELLGVADVTQSLVDKLQCRLADLDERVKRIPPPQRLTVLRVLDIAEDELIVAGPQSFQYDVIARAGGLNVTTAFDEAYPKVPFEQIKKWDAAIIFICGSDKKYLLSLKGEQRWKSLAAVKKNRLYQFDCGLTCRTSPRIVDMAELLFQTAYG